MSRTLFSLAGFQVITIGRFWVIAEIQGTIHTKPANDCENLFYFGHAASPITLRSFSYLANSNLVQGHKARKSGGGSLYIAEQDPAKATSIYLPS